MCLSLVCSGAKKWDTGRVHEHFQEVDVKAIWETYIPQREARDRIAWVDSVDGQYKVKTRYGHWYKHNVGVITETNVVHGDGWKKIWKLMIPQKLRIFL